MAIKKFKFKCKEECCNLPCIFEITEHEKYLKIDPRRLPQILKNLKNVCPQNNNMTNEWEYIGTK